MIHFAVPDKQGGVCDFSRILQSEMGTDMVNVVPLSVSNATAWEIQSGDSVVLQMSGYGFSKRGAPLWLLREMERRRHESSKFGVFFHELYAFGPPWKSAFWVSPAQRYVVCRLAEMSDFWMTNREGSAQWLRRYAGNKPHAVLPVFSNVCEIQSLPAVRKNRLVVFGSAGLRTTAYRTAGRGLLQWAKRQSIEIHDVGPTVTDPQVMETLMGGGVIQHGRLEADKISDLMRDSRFGVIAYPIGFIAKSGVFAAYCAHGLCPVILSKGHAPSDGLLAGQHYLPGIPTGIVNADKAQRIGEGAWGWYQSHKLACHVAALREFLDIPTLGEGKC
ncbi:hypothetical protein HF289_16620 [Acidithiobacillus ferrooxidans]|uniref:hypothetical protein n=1 Tax=Acidithiobacillus ferrooxidans TaxID=920 RepID=UPI000B323B99|nr:hypothetical protein [Acidithiobacillus ferrooxidans]MBU2858407.1 hypothetical protein [Acidithiobacillus ferrooxidans]MCR2830699.1 hypothetical protein [Acidithiobacillus ferrooxidans]